MRITAAVVAMLALLVVDSHVVSLAETGVPSAPAPSSIAATLRGQLKARGAGLDVKYKWGTPGEPESGKRDLRYAWTPSSLLIEEVRPDGVSTKSLWDGAKGENRTLLVTKKSKIGVVGPVQDGLLVGQGTIDPIVRPLDEDSTLIDVLARGTVSPVKEDVEGVLCWRVDCTTQIEGEKGYSIWVDPSMNFSPRRLALYGRMESDTSVFTFSDYREIASGAWFPMKIHVTFEKPRTATEPARPVSYVYEVRRARAGESLSLGKLQVRFPRGTSVTDNIRHRSFIAQ